MGEQKVHKKLSGAAARTGEFKKEEGKTMWILYREKMVEK